MEPASHLSGRRLSRRPDKCFLRAEARAHFSFSTTKLTDNNCGMSHCRKMKGAVVQRLEGRKQRTVQIAFVGIFFNMAPLENIFDPGPRYLMAVTASFSYATLVKCMTIQPA